MDIDVVDSCLVAGVTIPLEGDFVSSPYPGSGVDVVVLGDDCDT